MMGWDLSGVLYTASTWILPVLFAITLHEAAHGFVAWRLGDDTAYRLGRVSFNPLRHVDRFGTIILPALLLLLRAPFLFGWAKPVPVNFARLGQPRRDMALVAAAGPAINLTLAILSAALIHAAVLLPETAAVWLAQNLWNSVTINVVLALFNMLPLPPLDGGRVAVGLLPRQLAMPLARLEKYGLLIIIGLLLLAPMLARELGFRFDLFRWLIGVPTGYLQELIATLTGLV